MPAAGQVIRALDFPPSAEGVAQSFWQATITSYGKTISAGTQPTAGFAFVAPTSGAVEVTITAQLDQSAAGSDVRLAAEIRTGETVGSGTLIDPAVDAQCIVSANAERVTASRTYTVQSGLTPGATYNIDLLWKVSAGTGAFDDATLIVTPRG